LERRRTISPSASDHFGASRLGSAPQHVGIEPAQDLVRFELALDLHQKCLGDLRLEREDRDRQLRIAQHFLDDAGEADGGRLVVIPGPQIEPAVRIGLDLAAAREHPGVQRVVAVERPGKQEEAVVASEQRQAGVVETIWALRVEEGLITFERRLVVEKEELLADEIGEPLTT
jgi:hypothetical protein